LLAARAFLLKMFGRHSLSTMAAGLFAVELVKIAKRLFGLLHQGAGPSQAFLGLLATTAGFVYLGLELLDLGCQSFALLLNGLQLFLGPRWPGICLTQLVALGLQARQ